MSLADRIQFVLSYLVSFVLFLAFLNSLYLQNWYFVFLSLLALFITYIPAILRKSFKIILPLELDFLLALFVLSTLYLGDIQSFYTYFWWWDIFLHGLSGVLTGFFGFLLVFVLNSEVHKKISLSPFFVALFSFTFAQAIGVVWEIFEFFLDYFFQTGMQDGLLDTMSDLIVNALGALIVSVFGAFYNAKVPHSVFDRFVIYLIKKYPGLFGRFS